ncbi:transposase [Variovorax sp. J22R115]|uniref:transposase n=1 Tax=Variovorax sp. J22R115 TaxID=3053509 RepID=UPI002575F6E2|nr:transposase [Variovorax sp. J22R115]MDM0051908.1 transposase [Variovorax sp. J22R115]
MARLPRLTLADQPHHVIQRGNNRQPVFVDRADHEFFLGLIGENAARFGIALHAYVLMDNHFHLLATPSTADGLPQWMQAVGRRYVRYFNDRHGRTGTLWEGRYRSTLIQTDRYLLTCMVYIDLNPVRAGTVTDARDFPWSSHGHYVGLRQDRFLTPHPLYWALGNTPFAREAAYAELVRGGISSAVHAALTDATLRGWAVGDEDFLHSLQKTTDRRVLKARPGRPPTSRSE